MFQGCVTAKDDDGECHNGYGLALKNLKQYEQATSEFKKAIDLDPELYDALYNAGMAYSDWFDEAHGNDQKEQGARVPAEVRRQRGARPPTATTSRRRTTSSTRCPVRKPTDLHHAARRAQRSKATAERANTPSPGRFPVFRRASPCYKNPPIFSSVSRT